FKETYLKDMPLVNEANERLLVKRALNIYHNKGDEQGVKIAIRALYNQDSAVYLPGDDLFKLSDGKWVKPKYIEVSVSERNTSYVNKEIVGTISGAKAFCEEVVRKRINGKYFDVMYLSNIRGDFSYQEKIVEVSNTNILNAPTVIGSLNFLSVINGGQNFAVGDEFNVVSNNGKNAKAIVTAISNETGRVTFSIIDGGWGYSNTATVYVSDKVLGYSNLTNSNNSITNFQLFEAVSQNLMSVGFTTAVNSNIYVPNTIIFAQGNSSVSNATAGIVSVTLISNTEGVIKVTNLSGNIAATNSTIKASLVDLVYDTSSNISLFANGSYIESINSTSNATAFVISASSTNSTHGSLLIRPVSGNVASVNTSFRLTTNIATIGVVNTYTSNLYYTATIANNSNITANGILIGQNTSFIGLDSVLNTFYPNSIFSYVRGLSSNSYANINFVSTGSGATFQIGSLDKQESVLLNPDLLSSNNTGNVPFLDINLDLSPNNANATGFGFVKFPGANVNTILLDALRFTNFSIGEVASLKSINPGSSYNINPFVMIYEPDVAGYKRKDYIFNISSASKQFATGERIEQTNQNPAVILTVNTFSGTAANGSSTSNFDLDEFVYQSNGTANIASGYVYSTSLSGGAGDVKLRDVSGTFETTPTHNYVLHTLSTNATANISLVNTAATITTTAYGEIKAGSNTTLLKVKRISFGNSFGVGNTIIGKNSGANAVINIISEDSNTLPIGMNADIGANVQVANAVVTNLQVIDSGYGYLDGENVSLEKSGSVYIVSAQANLVKQGVGEGYYKTSSGFLSDNKKIIDSNYYQEYSYEIQSKVPFSKYYEVLNKLIHVAGTKMFGKVIINSFACSQISSANSSTRKLTLNYTNGTTGNSFSNSEFIVFSNGNSNSTIGFVSSNNISSSISNGANVIVIQVPDSNNSFVVGREVYMPNANSYVASGNVVAKNSNNAANITILYITNVVGTFTSSNTISGHVSSNLANSSTTGTVLTHAVNVFGYGNVHVPTLSTLTIPVSNTLSSSLTGTINVSNSSVYVTGTGTSFTSNFANNGWIQIISGATTDIRQIKTVSNNTYMVLRSYPSFTNSASTFKKSSPFISNTLVKMPSASSNVAVGNVFSYEANSTYFTYYLNNVYGSFKDANTVEGYINSSTTNTYSLFTAINTIVIANTENDVPHHSTMTGISSGSSANVSYVTVRYEK
ncbi:hypothetical protein EB155_03515, partial [archaeon]|nr:hypothetical protein [archaeon]